MKLLLVLLLLPAAILAHEDMTARHGDFAVKVIGQGGQIQVFRQIDGEPEPTIENKITLEMDVMNEKTASGDGVGHPDHSYTAAQWQDILYCFTNIVPTTVPDSNVEALTFTYNHTLTPHEAQIYIYIYMITTAGQVTIDGEVRNVEPGMVKVTYELLDWEFCNITKCQQPGAILDLEVTIKGIGTHQADNIGDLQWGLGRNGWIKLSKKVEEGGSYVDMPEGFPNYYKHGTDHQHFSLRFGKSSSIVYDPIFQAADPGSGSAVIASVTSMLAALLATQWLSL